MRFTTMLILAASTAILTGCAPAVSIHPLYTTQDLASDLPLEGTWAETDTGIWHAAKSGDGYDVTLLHTDASLTTEAYNVHLLRLKDADFLDVTSKSDAGLGITGHLLAKVWLEGDELRAALLDDAWLKKTLAAGLALPFVKGEGEQIILTAPTSSLQRFILLHAADPDAWDANAAKFHRLR